MTTILEGGVGIMMKNIAIRSKLKIVFISLMALVIATSILFLAIVTNIISTTEDLYNHPYTVSNLTLEVKSDIRHLYSMTEEMTETTDPEALSVLIDQMETLEDEVQTHIDMIKELYLGDFQDVENIDDAFLLSKSYRDTAITLTLNEQYDDAFNYRFTTIKNHTGSTIDLIQVVEDFANNKAIELTNEANRLYRLYYIVVLSSATLVVLLSFALFALLILDISPEIEKILKVIKTQGKEIDILDLDRKDELGYISRNLSDMLHIMSTQEEIKELNMKLANLRDKENLRITLMSIGDGVITTDTKGIITSINPVASMLTEYTPIEAIGQQVFDVFNIVNKFSRKKVDNPVFRVIEEGKIVGLANHTVLISKNGKEFDISDSGAPIIDDNGQILGVVLVFHDVTKEYANREKIEYLTRYDSLTNLFNRTHLIDTLTGIELNKTSKVGLILFDIDNLKLLNSNFDVSVGNEALKVAAKTLQQYVNNNIMIFRYGGDEFAVLVKNADEDSLRDLARSIVLDFSSKTISGISMTLSYGISMIDKISENIGSIIIDAEEDLYRYKSVHMNSSHFSVLKMVLRFITEKYQYEKHHSEYVGFMSAKLGEKLSLNQEEIDELSVAGMFHDIGKITIADKILTKPGKLTDEEYEIIKKHPVTGYEIIKEAIPYSKLSDYILHHHERYDGKGYPSGLKGENIPLISRIICVVDAYEAMTSSRVYREKASKKEAIEELNRCKGSQFDPKVTEAFINLVLNEKEGE